MRRQTILYHFLFRGENTKIGIRSRLNRENTATYDFQFSEADLRHLLGKRRFHPLLVFTFPLPQYLYGIRCIVRIYIIVVCGAQQN